MKFCGAAKYVMLSTLLTANVYGAHLVSRLEELLAPIQTPLKINVKNVKGVSVFDLKDGSGLNADVGKSLFLTSGNFDVPLFFILEAIEYQKLPQDMNYDQRATRATESAFQIFVSKTRLNPRAVLFYLDDRGMSPLVPSYDRRYYRSKAKLLGLLLAEWTRVKGEGAQFRNREAPAEPMDVNEQKRLETEVLKELINRVSSPNLPSDLEKYLVSIKENSVDLRTVYGRFQSSYSSLLSDIRYLADGSITHEKLVLYEQILYKNLCKVFDKKINEVLGESFHLQSADQFFALRALYVRKPQITIPPAAAAYFAATDPVDSPDSKVFQRGRDIEYRLEESWGDLVNWKSPQSRRRLFNLFATAFKGTSDELLTKLQLDALKPDGFFIGTSVREDIDFQEGLSSKNYTSAHLALDGQLPWKFEKFPLELKALGKLEANQELNQFSKKVINDILLPSFNSADLIRLPLQNLINAKSDGRFDLATHKMLIEKLRHMDNAKSLPVRLSFVNIIGTKYSRLNAEERTIALKLMQEEYDSVSQTKIPSNLEWEYENLLETVREQGIPLRLNAVNTRVPSFVELIGEAEFEKLYTLMRKWESEEEKKESYVEIYQAVARRLINLKFERTVGLESEDIVALLTVENSWHLEALPLNDVRKIVARLTALARKITNPRPLINFEGLARGLLFHREVKNWRNEVPNFIQTMDDLRPLFITQENRQGAGVFHGHQNLLGISKDQEQYKAVLREILQKTHPFDFSIDKFLVNNYDNEYWKLRFRFALEKKLQELEPRAFGRWLFKFVEKETRAIDSLNYELRDFISALGVSKPAKSWRRLIQQIPADFSRFKSMEEVLAGWEESRQDADGSSMENKEAKDLVSMYTIVPSYEASRLSNEDLLILAKWVFPVVTEARHSTTSDTYDSLFKEMVARRSVPAVYTRLLEIKSSQIFSPKMQTDFIDWRLSGIISSKDEKPGKEVVRPIAKQIFNFFELEMKRSTARDAHILRWVDKLVMTPSEMEIIAPLLVSKRSLFELIEDGATKRIQILLNKQVDPEENLERIKMLRDPVLRDRSLEREAQVAYREQDTPIKALTMFALVHESLTLDLLEIVLGELTKFPEIKKLATYYVESLPSNERNIVFARLLANGQDGTPINLGEVLDLIGPIGARAKQILRMLPVLPQKYREQLDRAFDLTQPPSRFEVVGQLRNLLGKNFESNVRWVGPLLGSGTLNYGMLLEILNPKTGKYEFIVARVQKENIGGLVENENIVLMDTVKKALADVDPDVRRLGRVLDLVRSRVYSSLNVKTGPELHQEIERQFSKELRQRDNSVVEFRNEYLTLVSENDRSKISFLPFIDKVSWQSLEPRERAQLAEKIVRKNLRLLESGVIDKDPSRGNELVDKNRKLTRIDTGQPARFTHSEVAALKYLSSLIMGSVDRPSIELLKYIQANLSFIFELPANKELDGLELARMKNTNWSNEWDPLNRIVLLAESIDPDSIVSLRPKVADFFEVLLRVNSWSEFLPKKQYESIMVEFLSGRGSRIGFLLFGPSTKPKNFGPSCSGLF